MYKTKLPLFASKEKHVGKKHYLFLHKDFDRSKKLSQFTLNGQNFFFLANTLNKYSILLKFWPCNLFSDSDDEAEEALKPKQIFNPYRQRVFQVFNVLNRIPQTSIIRSKTLLFSIVQPNDAEQHC